MIARLQDRRLTIFTFCLLAFLVSRAALTVVGILAYSGYLPISFGHGHAMNMHLAAPWLDIWFAWDSDWYRTVLEGGYQDGSAAVAGAGPGQANWAFFPLYPLLGSALSIVTGMGSEISLLLVANISLVGALYLLHLETEEVWGRETARIAVLLLLTWPGTHFLSSAYTESLFLFFVITTFRLARKNQLFAAALVAALATLTRSPGIFLTLPVAFFAWGHWLRQNQIPHSIGSGLAFAFSRRGAIVFAYCCIPLLALAGFMLHLHAVTGDALAFVTVQEAWRRSAGNPLLEFVRPFVAPDTIPLGQWPDFIAMALVPIPILVMLVRRDWPSVSFALPLFILAISAGVVSLNRQMLIVFPLITMTAAMLAGHMVATRFFLAMTATGALIMMVLWSAGYGIV